MARTATAQKHSAISPASVAFEPRASVYGGLVGQMIEEIDLRMQAQGASAAPAAIAESPEDFLHTVSVACGYLGLAAGFAAAIAGILLIL